jgi:hypothetical protein
LPDGLQRRCFTLHFLREFVPQLLQVNLTQIEEFRVRLARARIGGANGFVDDPVKLLEQVGDIGGVAALFEFFVDGLGS